MTCRPLSSKDCYSYLESRLSQQIRCETTGEGCSVIDKSGTVCGETNTLSIFQEFRQLYDDCLKKLEGCPDGSATLKKLAPFTKLVEDLWEQNTMLVETVEELEQEAASRVTNLQDKLNKSCQKIKEYEEDVASLMKVICSVRESGEFDTMGLKFNTVCPCCVGGDCNKSCDLSNCDVRWSEKNSGSLHKTKRHKPRELRTSDKSYSLKSLKSTSILPAIKESKRAEDAYNINDTLCRNFRSQNFGSELEFKSANRSKLQTHEYFNEPSRQNSANERINNLLCCMKNCEFHNDNYTNTSGLEDDTLNQNEYGQCLRSININFNIGNDSNDSCHCSCFCMSPGD